MILRGIRNFAATSGKRCLTNQIFRPMSYNNYGYTEETIENAERPFHEHLTMQQDLNFAVIDRLTHIEAQNFDELFFLNKKKVLAKKKRRSRKKGFLRRPKYHPFT